MNWLMNLVISLMCWLHIIERHGRPIMFTPDIKVGRFYIGGISAWEGSVFSDALRSLADMKDLSVADSNARYYMLRLQVVAMTLCDRWGNRLYNHNAEATLRELQNLPVEMLNALFIAAADKTGLHWVLPDDEYEARFGNHSKEDAAEKALAENP